MSKRKSEENQTATHEEYPDRASGREVRERESVKIAQKAHVEGQPMHKIGEVIPGPDGSVASSRLGGVNSNMEPNDSTSEEERLRATSNDGEAQNA